MSDALSLIPISYKDAFSASVTELSKLFRGKFPSSEAALTIVNLGNASFSETPRPSQLKMAWEKFVPASERPPLITIDGHEFYLSDQGAEQLNRPQVYTLAR